MRRVAVVHLPGASSRFDYADLDPLTHQLFLAHMANGELVQVETGSRYVVRVVGGLPSVTGVIAVPSLERVFASAAGAGQVVSIDEATGRMLRRVPAGEFPDGLAYVPTTGQVWVSDESGGVETVLDARTGQAVTTVRLGGEAGTVRYDPVGDRPAGPVQWDDAAAWLRRTSPNRSKRSRPAAAAASETWLSPRKPWTRPLCGMCCTSTPTSRNCCARALPSSRNGSCSAVASKVGGRPVRFACRGLTWGSSHRSGSRSHCYEPA